MLPDELVLHPASRKHLENYLRKLPHALILEGNAGLGKYYLLENLVKLISGTTPESYILVDSQDNSIKIDQIRKLKEQLKLKAISGKRCVIIPDADRLTTEAQNTLLKILEEPPANTYFLISVTDRKKLLETVVSRSNLVIIRQPKHIDTIEYLKSRGLNSDKAQTIATLSDHRIGLATKLLSEDTLPFIEEAKQMLRESPLKRLTRIDNLQNNKDNMPGIFFALERILTVGLENANNKNYPIDSWVSRLSALERAETAYEHNVSTRVMLTQLFINL